MDVQSWVVGVLSENDASAATSLLQSINRTCTRMRSTVVVSRSVTKAILEELNDKFDHLITLEESSSIADWDEFVTKVVLECYTSRLFGSFIYIDCNSWVLKNIDHLVQTDESKMNRLLENGTILLLSCNKSGKILPKSPISINEIFKNCTSYSKFASLEEINCVSAWRSTRIISLRTLKEAGSERESLTPLGIGPDQVDTVLFNRVSTFLIGNMKKLETASLATESCDVSFDSVAVVGMSLRFPGANNVDEFWSLLAEGRDGITFVPDCRWNEKYCTKDGKGKDAQAGFLSFSVDDFDAQLFNMSPMEASYMDPQQRMVLELVWEALEDAGINLTNLKGSQTGVFGGWWRDDFKEIVREAGGGQRNKFLRLYMGNTLGTVTSRVSHVLGLTGPSVATGSACSTSMVAVDLAVKSLQNNECSTAVAFGVNLFLHSFGDNDFSSSVVAPDGRSKAYDARADGYGRAEGCAVLVLKRYGDAVDNNDRILGVIRGSAVVQDGLSGSLGTPTVDGEAMALKLALERARVNPKDVEFVESHGSGTPVGDPLEMAAIAKAYGCEGRKMPLVVGSVKTNIGHTESTSGIAGIIKTLLTLEHEVIPRHVNFKSLNPNVNLEAVPAVLPLEPIEWKRSPCGRPRLAGVSSFGITGTNAHVILQESPQMRLSELPNLHKPTHPLHILKMSASSQNALNDLKQSYIKFLESKNSPEIHDITFSINTGRADLSHRIFAVGNSKENLVNGINRTQPVTPKSTPTKICFLFTGQGSQFVGMSRELYNSHPIFKSCMDFCFNFLQKIFALNLQEVMWEGDIETLSQTKYSHSGIFCVEYSLLKLWESWGIRPDCVLGHSLGECAAAVAAGILSVEDALTLVATRSLLIDKLENGSMLVLKGNKRLASSLMAELPVKIKDALDIAAMNTEDQTVVAGTTEAINKLKEFCKSKNVKSTLLKSSHAFHSKMMDPMLDELVKTAQKIQHKLPVCTYVSGMEGTVMESLNPEYWKNHTRKWVNFLKASSTVLEEVGCDLYLEVGPQPILSSFILENKMGSSAISCFPSLRRSEEEWMTMLTSLGNLYQKNVSVDWEGFHTFCGGSKVPVPFYPFQRKQIPFPEAFVLDFYPSVHPLVGTQVSNLSETKIFQNILRLENHSFLKDHVVGSLLLYPGAAFLETCLVAGYTGSQCLEGSFQTPLYPISLEKFQIETPLALDERTHTKLQSTVVEKENQTYVSVGSQATLEDGTKKWIQHASGIFQPFVNLEKNILSSMARDLTKLKNSIQDEVIVGKFYDKLADEGLKFGPTFRTIERVWKDSNAKDGILVEVNVKCEGGDHLLHPVVIDAMFQTSVFSKLSGQEKMSLSVPISVEKFVWYNLLRTSEAFIHIANIPVDPENTKLTQTSVTLFDAEGETVAIMLEPTILETTLATIICSIEANKNAIPPMFEDAWRSQRAPLESRMNFENWNHNDEVLNPLLLKKNLTGEGQEFYEVFNQLSLLHLIKCLRELGFKFDNDITPFTLNEVILELKVVPKYSSFVFYILMELLEEGYLVLQDENLSYNSEFFFAKKLPSLPEAARLESSLVLHPILLNKPEIQDVAAVGNNLSKILQGSVSPLALLFNESRGGDGNSVADVSPGPAESYYNSSQFFLNTHDIASQVFSSAISPVENVRDSNPNNAVRILEVGAGTGSMTKVFAAMLPKDRVEYTYTDISPVFFKHGENIFKDYPWINATYSLLNIEEDPMSQGFMPTQFDVVIAGFVVHATKDLQITLHNIKRLMAPHGILLLLELSKPIRSINILFGTLDGFSAFTDHDLRKFNCELPSSKWEGLLEQSGFGNTRIYPANNDHSVVIVSKNVCAIPTERIKNKMKWVFFGATEDQQTKFSLKLREIGRPSYFHEIRKSPEQFENFLHTILSPEDDSLEGIVFMASVPDGNFQLESFTKTFLCLCKFVGKLTLKRETLPLKFILVTRSQNYVDMETLLPPSSLPLPSIYIGMLKAFQNENPHVTCKSVDLSESLEFTVTPVINEMFLNDKEISVAYTDSSRNVRRLVPLKQAGLSKNLSIPKSRRFHLTLPESNAIEDLKFTPAPQVNLGDNYIEVQVVTYSLNFQDVLMVKKPSEFFEKINDIGVDYAGIVVNVGLQVSKFEVGDEVFGLSFLNENLPSSLCVDENCAMKLPESMTFEEGATLPAAAGTVYVSLAEKANLKKEDTILIHMGSGGVGLAAIQFAKHVGCRIVATAGNERKRAYLRRLGVEFVYNSRSTNYLAEIHRDVGGVDVVLNSLTCDGFKEATLAACNRGARFVEINKLNVWSAEEIAELRPDVHYSLAEISRQNLAEAIELTKSIERCVSANIFQPIPYVKFEASDIREALTYKQKAKQIGKIVCGMPRQGHCPGSWVNKPFNERSTYLITGGLGGIGMETCKWMLKNGARFIILTGRNPPKDTTVEKISALNKAGAEVLYLKCDVGDFQQCSELLNQIKSLRLPPLRGIMHAAGVLSDGSYENQTWEKFRETFQPKVNGSLNLHKLTLTYRLEHFVFFSSIASNLGTMGKSNHCAANAFMDHLAFHRHSLGLPATTINLGQVEVAANKAIQSEKPMTTLQCVSALELCLRQNRIQTTISETDENIVTQCFSTAKRYLEEISLNDGVKEKCLTVDSVKFWKDYDDGSDLQKKREVVKTLLKMIIKQVVRLGDDGVIEDESKFQEIGMDSLMMVEMKNNIQSTLGDRVQVSNAAVKDCTNVSELSRKLVDLINGDRVKKAGTELLDSR